MLSDGLAQCSEGEAPLSAVALLSAVMPFISGLGIAIKSVDGFYEQASRSLEILTGKPSDWIVGRSDSDLFSDEIASKQKLTDRQIVSGRVVLIDDLGTPQKSGDQAGQLIKFPVLDTQGATRAIGIIVLDTHVQESLHDMRQTIEQLRSTVSGLQADLVEFERQASTDRLTGAWNRRHLEETAASEMERFRRYDQPLCLLVLDVDSFKKVNDQHGHMVGDSVLRILAHSIQSVLRVTDSLTRWGGEEFVVLSPGTDLSAMALLAERLREQVARTSFPSVKTITVSIGVAECLRNETWEAWFQRADVALYRAKACGRNQVLCSPESERKVTLAESLPKGFADLVWHASYESGLEFLDDQHHALFVLINSLLSAILEQRPRQEIDILIDRFIKDAAQHFEEEEALLAELAYPGLAEHAFKHARLIDTTVRLAVRFHCDLAHLGELFLFLSHEVVARHLLGDDREFFPFIQLASGG